MGARLMSYIQIWETEISESPCEFNLPSLQKGDERSYDYDSETLAALRGILYALDHLDNGEAIVITVDLS